MEFIEGSPPAVFFESTQLAGRVRGAGRCHQPTFADLNRTRLDGWGADGLAHPQAAVTLAFRAHVLVVTAKTPAGRVTLRLTRGTAASFDSRVRDLRAAAEIQPLDVAVARKALGRAGFTLDPTPAGPWVEPQFPSAVRVVHGTCTGSGDGACQHMFFFYGDRYLGTDTAGAVEGVTLLWRTGDTFALAYPRWRAGDSVCCPRGGTRVVRFRWTGTRIVPIDYLPPDPNS